MEKKVEHYKHTIRKCTIVGIVLLILTIILCIFFASQGAMKLKFVDTQRIVWAKITGNQALLSQYAQNEIAIIWDIRLPRIICGVFVGGGLAVAGAMFQSLLKNPLADPYTLGVSTGAAFGASLAIIVNILYGIYISITLSAFAAAFITLILVIFVANRGGGLFSSNLIIAGIIVGSILSAGISFIKMIAGENVSAIVFWLMGLVQKPKLLLMDEAMSDMDVNARIHLTKILKKQIKDDGLTVVEINHDLNMAYRFSDKIIALKEGIVDLQGIPAKVMDTEFFKRVFRVEVQIIGDYGFFILDNI